MKPFQGLKRSLSAVGRGDCIIAINMKPFQGLKQMIQLRQHPSGECSRLQLT